MIILSRSVRFNVKPISEDENYGRKIMGDNPIAWNAMKERRKERLKMGRKPERNSNKRIKTISGKGKKRYREKYKTLVRYRTGRKKRQNTFARYLLRSKISRTYKKTLEIRVCVYRRLLQ